ncbi:MAG: bifunctional metallophosphatase/5'-nucleotidase [Muribaculaceae bacterium]|nr:bifunctional metallophosphatase/5'-nucleotidase [Muribaculaceae bacterium]
MRVIKSLLLSLILVTGVFSVEAEKLVILHSNDTHSQIDPNDKNQGGVLRRKAVIDSVRGANENVLLVDAGDAVQGTLFFYLYKGEVEYSLLEKLGYDVAILGNHDFDNGSEMLAEKLKDSKINWLSTNYELRGGPLDGIFMPYVIKEYGGKKIALMGLEVRPEGLISNGNYNGVEYIDAVKAANATAWHLKHNEKVDMVIALTHLGYSGKPGPKDVDLAAESEDVDIIIGGHSHTYLDPADKSKTVLKNAVGKDVLVTQAGKQGTRLGEITIDLDTMTPVFNVIEIDSRLDKNQDADVKAFIDSYRPGIDSLYNLRVARSAVALENNQPALNNLLSDFVAAQGSKLAGKKVDMAIMNKGSVRRSLPKGDVTEGVIIDMQPFNNYLEVLEIKGSDLIDAFNVMSFYRGGDSVSSELDITMDRDTRKCTSILLNGKPIDPDRIYTVATIDYLANGGDNMEPLTRGTKIAHSENVVNQDLLNYLRTEFKKKKINPDNNPRMHY